MVEHLIHIGEYWSVLACYNIDQFSYAKVCNILVSYGVNPKNAMEVLEMLHTGRALAFTYSNKEKHISIAGFVRHTTKGDLLNSIVHEAEHIKQDILEEYAIPDTGEHSAYLIGYIIMKMYRCFKRFL